MHVGFTDLCDCFSAKDNELKFMQTDTTIWSSGTHPAIIKETLSNNLVKANLPNANANARLDLEHKQTLTLHSQSKL